MPIEPRPSLLRRIMPQSSAKVDEFDPGDMGTAIALDFILDEPRLAEMHAAQEAERAARAQQPKRSWWQLRSN